MQYARYRPFIRYDTDLSRGAMQGRRMCIMFKDGRLSSVAHAYVTAWNMRACYLNPSCLDESTMDIIVSQHLV